MSKKRKIIAIAVAAALVAAAGIWAADTLIRRGRQDQASPLVAYILPEKSEDPINNETATIEEKAAPVSFMGMGLTDEQAGWLMQAMDTGELPDLTEQQIAELRGILSDFLDKGYFGVDSELILEQFDRLAAALETGEEALETELEALLMTSANEILDRALAEGIIEWDLYDFLKNVLETGEIEFTEEQIAALKEYAVDLLNSALSDGVITQDLYEIAISALETGREEIEAMAEQLQAEIEALMDRLQYEPEAVVMELLTEIEALYPGFLDELEAAYVEFANLALEALAQALDEGLITQGLHDILYIFVAENGAIDPDALEAELKLTAIGLLTQAFDEGLLTAGLYDILVEAVETGNLEISTELIVELQSIVLGALDWALASEAITQEQHDWLVSEIRIAVIQIGMNGAFAAHQLPVSAGR